MRNRRDSRESEHDFTASINDPFADVFFTLAAFALIALVLIGPDHSNAGSGADAAYGKRSFEIDGKPAFLLVAAAKGVEIFGVAGAVIPLKNILDDVRLRDSLRRAKDSNDPILMIVEPDGMEAAFQLEAALASSGVTWVHQVRNEKNVSKGALP